MSVIINVDSKVEYILSLLDNSYTEDEFLAKFKEIYPKDYEKCWKKFIKEEINTKIGKPHPMQHPDKHIKNALKSYISRKKNTMKTIKQLLITIAVLLCSATMYAYDFEVDGIYYDITSSTDLTVEVTSGYIESSGSVIIPSTVAYSGEEYSVTSIGYDAFSGCSGLTSITIPESVTSIKAYAFNGCTSLKDLRIEDGSTTLELSYNYHSTSIYTGKGLFYDCPLETLYLGRNLSYNTSTSYGYSPFYNQDELKSLTISNNVTSIGSYAFRGCSGLTSITIPESVTSISDHAFSGCSGLTSITIPESVTSISDHAFSGCSGLTSITIPESVTYIGDYAFSGCRGLTSITIPESVTSIRDYAFSDCSGLTSFTIPESVTSIYEHTFSGCSGLTSITIPESVTSIESYAFSDCSGLTSITIPESVTYIGNFVFINCTSLKDLRIEDGNTTLDLGANASLWACSSLFNDCPLETLYLGRNLTCKILGSYSGSTYGCMPFYNQDELKSLTISNNVTYIGGSTFRNCSGLTSITIPESVTSIGNSAFHGCSGLTSITIPESVTYIGSSTFSGCSGLTSITIPESVTSIGSSAFSGCSGLTSITIPESVTSIGDYAFSGCSGLDGFSFGSNLKTIGAEAFSDCTNITSITSHAEVPPTCSEQALDDINKWTCVLKVPQNYASAYQAADQWKEFFYIEDVVEIELFTITYIVDGEVYATEKYVAGDEILPEEEPTKEGYTFSGWSEIPETMPAEDVTVTGSFSINSYDLVYMVDGEEYKRMTLEFGSEILPEEEPTKEGYTFSGWSEIPETMPAEDVTVTGSFSINSYDLVYMIDGEEYKRVTLEFGSEILPEEEPEKEGYTFSGWSDIPETMPAHDVTVTGSFSINSYDLVYLVDDEEYKRITLEFGSEILPEEEPEKEGYTFSGWSDIPETMPAHDVTVTGSFSINSYDLVYMIDGEEYKRVTLEFGSEIVPEEEPEKEGYTFSGWSEIPETMPAEDVTVTGSFSINSYDLVYMIDGEEYKRVTLEFGSEIIPEEEPEKEGYTFSGWSEIPETMPAHDVTITGSFSINSYDLVYMIDGEEYKRVTLEFGSEIIPEEEPTKEGYTFSGWSEIPETIPAEDVIVTGSFSINSYDLVYLVDDEEYKRITLEFGSEIIPEEEPVKEGYTFSGWSEIPETMPSHDVEITGSFIPTNVSEIIAEVSLQVNGNSISLSNANNSTVAIYSINGVLVKRIDKYTGEEITLDKGIYIVCVGDKAMKIIL